MEKQQNLYTPAENIHTYHEDISSAPGVSSRSAVELSILNYKFSFKNFIIRYRNNYLYE